jgi:hypothetical protein
MDRLADYHKQPEVAAVPLGQTIESTMVVAYSRDRVLSDSARLLLDSIGDANDTPGAES